MITLKNTLSAAGAGVGIFWLVAPAHARASDDCWTFQRGTQSVVSCILSGEGPTNTGIAVGNDVARPANGYGVTLWDRDLVGTEGGNPGESDSDYIYVDQGTIWFSSDTEANIPGVPPGGVPANRLQENGQLQNVGTLFGYNAVNPAGTPFAGMPVFEVQSDVPEPAAWAMMLLGFGLTGGLLRRRAARSVASPA